MKNLQKGFVIPLLIAIVTLLAIVSGAYIYLNKGLMSPSNNLPNIINSVPTSTVKTGPQATKSEDLASRLLNARPGSLTPKQADNLFSDWLVTPDFHTSASALLSSIDEIDRGFAAYALLEKQGLTADIAQLATSDSSIQVRAVVFSWLFCERAFSVIRDLLQKSPPTQETVSELVQLVVDGRHISFPSPMSHLGGIKRYLVILAMYDPSVAAIISKELSNTQIADSSKSQLLQVFAAARPDSYLTDLWHIFRSESNSSARILTAQYIAAETSVTNTQVRETIMSAMPSPQPGIGPTHILFREEMTEEMRKQERNLTTVMQTSPPPLAALEEITKMYLKTLHMLEPDATSITVLQSISDLEKAQSEAASSDVFAEAAFVLERLQNK